ncbi:MAG: hypothetical protein WCP68_15065 [Enhydrobacter sp.]
MTRLQIGTRILATAVALVLVPAFAYAEGDELAKKDAPAGRQRLNPRPADGGSQLSGTPGDTPTLAAAPTLHGFGPMSGNPLFGTAMPLKSGN